MKTKTIELYEFDELSEDVRAKVLQKERYINVDDSFWSECILDEWEEKLTALGFESPEIAFSGFASQGDGASFTCKRVNLAEFTKAQKAKTRFAKLLRLVEVDDLCASVDRVDHHYSHANTVRANVDMACNDETDPLIPLYQELEALITSTVRTLSREIYGQLENEFFGLTTDEAVIDTIKANEYTFTASGRMENV